MSKFTFICEEVFGVPAKRTVEFDAVSLNDILSEVEMFLRGSGFYFHGTLDIVDGEEMVYQTAEPEKQNFDFTNIPQNNWPFEMPERKPQSDCISEKIKPLTVADLEKLNESKFPMPGTLGGAKVTFASDK